jgi:hypothetical protein
VLACAPVKPGHSCRRRNPDPLIAQILPSATLPTEIVLADRYVNGGGDPNLIDQQPWDASIKALARYPSVLKMMDDNLAWTTDLGQVFLYQQQDMMNSVQRLRAQAQALGNLQTTPQEVVVTDGGAINILPAQPQVIYVPVYQPEMVYFQRPFGDPFISFGFGFAIGGWLNYDLDWHNHHLIGWGYDHPRPVDWWSRRPSERPREEFSHTTVWAPRNRPDNELSPLGPLIAQAHVEGYRRQTRILTEDQSPYHGYNFKVLTRQGSGAPGGKYNYVINGHMIGGFALVAWPAQWGNSGVMTLIVNQQGKVYERNLGEKTPKVVAGMTKYNPDARWKLVGD